MFAISSDAGIFPPYPEEGGSTSNQTRASSEESVPPPLRRKRSTAQSRRKRSRLGRKRYLEVRVVADHTVVAVHGRNKVKNYIMTLMNVVSIWHLFRQKEYPPFVYFIAPCAPFVIIYFPLPSPPSTFARHLTANRNILLYAWLSMHCYLSRLPKLDQVLKSLLQSEALPPRWICRNKELSCKIWSPERKYIPNNYGKSFFFTLNLLYICQNRVLVHWLIS